MPLHMARDVSPTLLVAVYGLNGGSEQLSHLCLRLAQFLAYGNKLFAIHGRLQREL